MGREVERVLAKVSAAGFETFASRLGDTRRRWFFSGQGRSGLVAQMAAMRFMHLGSNVHFLGEATAPSVRRGDGLVLLSGSGTTPITLSFANVARQEAATVLAVTTSPSSRLASLADHVLVVPVKQTNQFGGSLFEQTALLLLDAIVLRLSAATAGVTETMRHRHTNLQ